MKRSSDRYTNALLTIIAACLVWICVRDLTIVPAAHAAVAGVTDVKIVGIERGPGDGPGGRMAWEPIWTRSN